MGTFTLAQNQVNKNLWLYPNGDLSTCTEFTSVGGDPNYTCVDENRLIPDEDSTYVWWDNPVAALDLYELPNHTIEIGTINYVQVYARGKSHETAQNIDGVYKVICSPDSTCSNVYKSDDINLVTGYMTYNKVWVDNPDDAAAWEWADIDALCIGVECDSPITSAQPTLTIRPNGNGGAMELDKNPPGNNWTAVNEAVKDDFISYVFTCSSDGTDLYTLQNHTTEAGTIAKVTIFAYVRGTNVSCWAKTAIKTQATDYFGIQKNTDPVDTWILISTDYLVNPNTLIAWTWADIDALQGGIELDANVGSPSAYCTQVYVVILYGAASSPQIRTTQCYAKVNYNEEVECTLNKPQKISTNHARNIKMLNFWNGSREVYDLNRSGKSMLLIGSEQYAGSCDIIICVRNMARNGTIITVSGLSLDYFNGDYRIRSFGWDKISEKPEHYKWILDLEDAN